MTIQELANALYKSKPSVSKYELGQTAIDIGTLYEIAKILGVSVEQLLYVPPSSFKEGNNVGYVPSFFRGISQFYLYMYDGRSKTINFCVVDILAETGINERSIIMYLHVSDSDNYQNCSHTYRGTLYYYDTLAHLILKNQASPIEQVTITAMSPQFAKDRMWGLFFGLSTRPIFPCAEKVLFSRKRLHESDDLVKELKVSKEDIALLKQYNMLVVL